MDSLKSLLTPDLDDAPLKLLRLCYKYRSGWCPFKTFKTFLQNRKDLQIWAIPGTCLSLLPPNNSVTCDPKQSFPLAARSVECGGLRGRSLVRLQILTPHPYAHPLPSYHASIPYPYWRRSMNSVSTQNVLWVPSAALVYELYFYLLFALVSYGPTKVRQPFLWHLRKSLQRSLKIYFPFVKSVGMTNPLSLSKNM